MAGTEPARELVVVTELRPGDMIDLEGDPYADPDHGSLNHDCAYDYEYTVVGGEDGAGELEQPGTYRLDHHDGACGFPSDHRVVRVGTWTPGDPTETQPNGGST